MPVRVYNDDMDYVLNNKDLLIRVSSDGAELKSIAFHGREYLWQGEQPWSSSSPVLFPFAGRRKNFCYDYCGKTYPMPLNGFAKDLPFQFLGGKNELIFELCDDKKTQTMYPFAFRLRIAYSIGTDTVFAAFSLENKDEKPMPYMWGLHPGFIIEEPSDWQLRFDKTPVELILGPDMLLTGEERPFARLYRFNETLEHTCIVKDYGTCALLYNDLFGRSVTIHSTDPDVLAIWRPPIDHFPLVSLEPWCGISDLKKPVPIMRNPHVRILAPHTFAKTVWSFTFK